MLLCRTFLGIKKCMYITLSVLALLTLVATRSYAFTPFLVNDIRVEGSQHIDPSTVISYLPVKIGQTFTDASASEAVRRLYESGFFKDIQIKVDNDTVILTVQERPLIASVNFSGLKEFNTETISSSLAKIGLGQGHFFDRIVLEKARDALTQQYLSKGKYSVEIAITATHLVQNKMRIRLDISEGATARIQSIHLTGNKVFPMKVLRDQMQATTSNWLTWYTNQDKFSRERLRSDIEKLQFFYFNHGYLECFVESPTVTISPDRKSIHIAIAIHEGKLYTLEGVRVAGNLMGLDKGINTLVRAGKNNSFLSGHADTTAKHIVNYLHNMGYAFSHVSSYPQLDRVKKNIHLIFYVDLNKRVYIRRIQISGNTRTRDEVIRRELLQQESAWYNAQRIRSSRDRIDRLGYFSEVDIKVEPVLGLPDQIDVDVQVKEKPTGMVNVGVGYGSLDGPIVSAGISEDNVFGSGNNLTLQFNTSKVNRSAIISQTNPYWTNNGVSRTLSAYYRVTRPWEGNTGDYHVTVMGLGLSFSMPISVYDRITLGGVLERNQIGAYGDSPQAYRDFKKQYGSSTDSFTGTIGWVRDTRDSAIAPTEGAYTRLKADFSTIDLKYYLLSAQQQIYIPLGRSYTLALNALVDYGQNYGKKDYPVIKNVYAGGIGTVRGYEGASLGPRDVANGDYLGGALRSVGNIQLYLPFPSINKDRTLRWFIFTDAGRVAASNASTCTRGKPSNLVEKPCDWRFSTGVGLSWQSPIGALQVSYGKPLNSQSGDSKQAFQFQIGTAF